jgi:type I restriction enzyme S subunit
MELREGYKNTEVGVIPEDWEVKKLYEIGKFSKGSGVRKDEALSGDIPCIRYGELYTKHSDYIKQFYSFISKEISETAKKLKVGDILFAGSGETKEEIGKSVAFIDDFEAYAGGDIVIFSPTNTEPLYLGYLLNAPFIQKQKTSRGQGDAVVHISANQLGNVSIPLPPTKAEQTAIATALSDADALINSLSTLIAKKRNIKQGAMQQLLKPKEGWEVKKLGEIAEIYQPQTISQDVFVEDGYLVYGANGVIGKFHLFNHETWQTTITCRGSTCGTVNRTIDKSWITGNAMVMNVDENRNIDKLFFYYILTKQDFSQCITGSGQPQIVRSPLFDFTISIPKSKEKQKEIAFILSDMDAEINALETKLEKYKKVKLGMMQNLLTGKIRLV